MAEKVIVTNESALRAKYGDEGWSDVRAEVENLIAADDRRGLKTVLVRLDRAQDMKPLGARVVQNARSEKQNKEAIDGVWEAKTLDYLLILGGPDVVPHQTLPNPVGGAGGDGDNTVASDLPYACDAPGGGGIEAYLAPTRAVGRLPNVFGDSKSAYLLRLLRFARRWRSRARKGYKTGFVLTASVWSGSTRQSARRLFGTSKGVHLSPPKGPVWPMAQLARRTHFINCHGAPLDPRYYGEDASGSVPVAHRSTQLAGLTEGTVAAAECCYGAELYDPSLLDTPKGIANAYLYKGTAGFLGSTTIAYGPASGNDKADLICLYFVREALKGASVGRAALEARLDYLAKHPALDPVDLKTLAQFYLLGDPSVHPVQSPGKTARAVPTRSKRRARRRRIARNSHKLARETLSVTSKPDKTERKTHSSALTEVSKKAGLGTLAVRSFTLREPKVRKGAPETFTRVKALAQGVFKVMVESKGSPFLQAKSTATGGAPIKTQRILVVKQVGRDIVETKEFFPR